MIGYGLRTARILKGRAIASHENAVGSGADRCYTHQSTPMKVLLNPAVSVR